MPRAWLAVVCSVALGPAIPSAESPGQPIDAYTKALDEMRARYLLTFYPQDERRAAWHALMVSLRRGRADITARPPPAP